MCPKKTVKKMLTPLGQRGIPSQGMFCEAQMSQSRLNSALRARSSTFDMLATAGTIGLHMVSGPMVGFALGYGLDYWLDTGPWCKLAGFLLGIAAGFKNVYDDSRRLLRKMQAEQAEKSA